MADKQRIPGWLKTTVAERARHLCEYCRVPETYSLAPRHAIDHIVPECDGGETEPGNLALACQGCNGAKSTKRLILDQQTGGPVALFHPREDRGSDHFAWSEDFLTIEGLTDKGRTTVEILRLNRLGVINIRRALILAGLHPPAVDE
jgi:HNH endonuclease